MRPHATQKDANHGIPREYLRDRCGGFETYRHGRHFAYTANFRGVSFMLIDTADFGGAMPDYILENTDSGQVRWLEVKTPEAYNAKDHSLKPGEQWLDNHSMNFRFIVTDEDMEAVLLGMLDE